jgi:hypothetical protein
VVELDGRLGHDGGGRFRDMRRDNRTLVAGEVTLRFGSEDVYLHQCLVARQVAAVLRQRGWHDDVVACPGCPKNAWSNGASSHHSFTRSGSGRRGQ